MSRVGKKVIEIPKDVKVNVTDSEVAIEGPKGKLAVPIPRQWRISFKLEDGKLFEKEIIWFWGTPSGIESSQPAHPRPSTGRRGSSY